MTGVLRRHGPPVDLLEELDQLLVAAELGVVVLDVARERSASFITSTWSMTASKMCSRGEYWKPMVTSTAWFLRYLPDLSPRRIVAAAAALELVGEDRGVEVEDLHRGRRQAIGLCSSWASASVDHVALGRVAEACRLARGIQRTSSTSSSWSAMSPPSNRTGRSGRTCRSCGRRDGTSSATRRARYGLGADARLLAHLPGGRLHAVSPPGPRAPSAAPARASRPRRGAWGLSPPPGPSRTTTPPAENSRACARGRAAAAGAGLARRRRRLRRHMLEPADCEPRAGPVLGR